MAGGRDTGLLPKCGLKRRSSEMGSELSMMRDERHRYAAYEKGVADRQDGEPLPRLLTLRGKRRSDAHPDE